MGGQSKMALSMTVQAELDRGSREHGAGSEEGLGLEMALHSTEPWEMEEGLACDGGWVSRGRQG